jgi:DNA polymerase III delta prime subunit
MLRSENVQVRSQLSTIQRRMFQEKQQIMDYLRQIENDLIEKEQIKQRELLLRQDYEQLQFANKQDRKEIEQLKNFINKDQQKIKELQDECSQLLKTIQTQNEEKIQLESQFDTYKSEILEDQYHIIQVNIHMQSEVLIFEISLLL